MSTAESLARSIIDPITTTQDTTTENIAAYRGLIAAELHEVKSVLEGVCNAMGGQFFIEHMDDIEFIHSRIESIGELAQNLAHEYEAQAKAIQGAKL